MADTTYMMKSFLCGLLFLLAACPLVAQVQSADIANPMSFYVTQPPGSSLCWAACDTMLLRSQGVNIQLPAIVIKAFGAYINKGAGPSLAMPSSIINDTWNLPDGTQFEMNSSVSDGILDFPIPFNPSIRSAHMSQDDIDTLIASIKMNHPVVIASVAHGRVCVGVDYIVVQGQNQITRLRLLNPEPGTGLENWNITALGNQMSFREGGYLGMISF